VGSCIAIGICALNLFPLVHFYLSHQLNCILNFDVEILIQQCLVILAYAGDMHQLKVILGKRLLRVNTFHAQLSCLIDQGCHSHLFPLIIPENGESYAQK